VLYNTLAFEIHLTNFGHMGLFPEQAENWDWLRRKIRTRMQKTNDRNFHVLNLFAYTGGSSLAASQAGAHVVHLDAAKNVVDWARKNAQLCSMQDRPIRWIVDDALKFVQREVRRGSTYDGIILDPPKFGRGPKGEVWEFYKLLPNLLQTCSQLLGQRPLFLLITAYAVKASSLTLHYALEEIFRSHGGTIQAGEVALQEQSAGRLVSMAIFARWSAGTKSV